MVRKTRVVIAKIGLDGHDVGAKVVAAALRDAGMEVIYTGLRQTPQNIVQIAIQEDADAIGISILSGSHIPLITKLLETLKEEGAEDIRVVAGGVIPPSDAAELKRRGVFEVIQAGADMEEIIECFRMSEREKSELS